jgi:hypothetical protein
VWCHVCTGAARLEAEHCIVAGVAAVAAIGWHGSCDRHDVLILPSLTACSSTLVFWMRLYVNAHCVSQGYSDRGLGPCLVGDCAPLSCAALLATPCYSQSFSTNKNNCVQYAWFCRIVHATAGASQRPHDAGNLGTCRSNKLPLVRTVCHDTLRCNFRSFCGPFTTRSKRFTLREAAG